VIARASQAIAMLLLAFVNTGIFGNAAGLICASILGLAIAQSKSRVLQQLASNRVLADSHYVARTLQGEIVACCDLLLAAG
jgi:hypothetical protein